MNKEELLNLRNYLKDTETLYIPYNYKEREEFDKNQAKTAKEFLSKTVDGLTTLKRFMKKNINKFEVDEADQIIFSFDLSQLLALESFDESNNLKKDYKTLSDSMEILVSICIKKDDKIIEVDHFGSFIVFYVASFKNFILELNSSGINVENLNDKTLEDNLLNDKPTKPCIVFDTKKNINIK